MAKSQALLKSDLASLLKSYKSKATSFKKKYEAFNVTSTTSFEKAGVAIVEIKKLRKNLKDLFAPHLDEAKKRVSDLKVRFLEIDDPISDVEEHLRDQVVAYNVSREAQREAKIEALEASGNDEKLAKTIAVPFTPQVSGLSFREEWSAEVVDFPALVKAVASGKAPLSCLMVNSVFLNSQARAEKENLSIIGVKAVKNTSSAVRT